MVSFFSWHACGGQVMLSNPAFGLCQVFFKCAKLIPIPLAQSATLYLGHPYLRPQNQVLLLQLLQFPLETLQLAECGGGAGPPQRLRLPHGGGHAGVGLALLWSAGHHPQQLILLTEFVLELVDLVRGRGLDTEVSIWEGALCSTTCQILFKSWSYLVQSLR